MRKHVYRLAEKLSADAFINPDHTYSFLMACGRDLGTDPTKLSWTTGIGIIFLAGHRDDYCLEAYRPSAQSPSYDGPDYEQMILARQEAWID